MSKIRDARVAAGLTAAQVASAVGRNGTWFGAMEVGAIRISPDHEAVILKAIDRLARFQVAVEAAREKLIADLRLPVLRSRRVSRSETIRPT